VLVDFYHLATAPIERVLPRICERLLEDGQRLLIVADAGLLGQLDTQLWSYSRDAFLPHGRSDKAGAEAQPILLGTATDPRNGATNIALADGVWRQEALEFARTFYFFDNAHLEEARKAWRMLGEQECQRRYWKQGERGKWVEGP
jgi:DNA polymerase-3 subunit chi